MLKITLLFFIVFSIKVYSQQNTTKIQNGNYYYNKPELGLICGLSFYGTNMFRYYERDQMMTVTNSYTNKRVKIFSKPKVIKGIGTYLINDSIIKLKFDSYQFKYNSKIKINSYKHINDSLSFTFICKSRINKELLPGTKIAFYLKDSLIYSNIADYNGCLSFNLSKNLIFDSITISNSGYQKYIIASTDINLANNCFNITTLLLNEELMTSYIEDTTKTFRINSISSESIELSFKNPLRKEFKDVNRRFTKSNYQIERLCSLLNLELLSKEDLNNHRRNISYTAPKFTGDKKGFQKYFLENFEYKLYYDNRGEVFLEFLIEPDGSVKKIAIRQSKDEEFTMEAIRLIKSTSEKWETSKEDGQNVGYIKRIRLKGYPMCGITIREY